MLVAPFSRQSLGLLPREMGEKPLGPSAPLSALQRYINYLREKIEGRLNLINLLGFIYTQAQIQKFSLSSKLFYNYFLQ